MAEVDALLGHRRASLPMALRAGDDPGDERQQHAHGVGARHARILRCGGRRGRLRRPAAVSALPGVEDASLSCWHARPFAAGAVTASMPDHATHHRCDQRQRYSGDRASMRCSITFGNWNYRTDTPGRARHRCITRSPCTRHHLACAGPFAAALQCRPARCGAAGPGQCRAGDRHPLRRDQRGQSRSSQATHHRWQRQISGWHPAPGLTSWLELRRIRRAGMTAFVLPMPSYLSR